MFLLRLDLDIGDVFDNLLPRLQEVGVQLLATFIALFFLYRFLWKPMRKFLKVRQDFIEANITEAEASKKKAEENLAKSQEVLGEAYVKYQSTLETANIDANKSKEQILAVAEEEKKKIIKQANIQADADAASAKEQLEKEVVSIALAAASKIIEREINAKDNEAIINNLLEDLKHE